MYAHVGRYMTMYDYLCSCMTIYDYVWLCITLYNFVWLYMSTYAYICLFKGYSKICNDYIWPCVTMYDQAGIFPANPGTLYVGNSQRKSWRIWDICRKNLINIVFNVHIKVYKLKISTIILNLFVYLCKTMFDYVWLCITMYDHV